jgi:transcriptional regulator with XRE-family HTH domain
VISSVLVDEIAYESPRQVFARRLREARSRRGWEQADLAARLAEIGYDLGQPQVSRIERGQRNVTLEDVLAIAAALDCAPLHLIVPIRDEEDGEIPEGYEIALKVPVRVKIAGLPPTDPETLRDWAVGGSRPLRVTLGVEPDSPDLWAAWMSQQPASWIRRVARVLGLTEDDEDDSVSSLHTGEIAFPRGDPRIPKEEDQGAS